MTPTDLRAIRKRAGLTQAELARVFRMGPLAGRTVRRWEAGDYSPPGPILLLYEMLHDGRLKVPGGRNDAR